MAASVKRAFGRFAAVVVAALAVRHATADLDFTLGNGSTVDARLSPATETETFRIRLAAGSRLSIAARAAKRRPRPAFAVRLLDANGADVAPAEPVGSTARLAGVVVPNTGEYRVVVTGDGSAEGSYRLAVAWTPPPNVRETVKLDAGAASVGFGADAGSTAEFSVRASRGSSALPRLVQVRSTDGAFVRAFDAPADATARRHLAKGVALPAGGDFVLDVANAGPSPGDALVRIDVRGPAVHRRRLDATAATAGAAPGDAVGASIGPLGGAVSFGATAGGELTGASIQVPAGALPLATAIVIGPGVAFAALDAALLQGGPYVHFGPSGLAFSTPATVTIPFDPTGLAGDFSSVRVYERGADGTVRLVPTAGYVFDASARTVSFPVDHFTSFCAFAPSVRLTETTGLLPSDGAAGDLFGNTVAVSGDTAVIGAQSADAAGADSGAAYVFVRTGTLWGEQAKLVASDAAASAFFGGGVAIDADTAAVAAFNEGHAGAGSGAVYVFTRSGSTWTETQKLVASDGAAGQFLGISIALKGDTLVAGASGDSHAGAFSGAAYVFSRSAGVWSEEAKLTASDGQTNDLFGNSVGVDGDTAVVGAPVSFGTVANTGAAYVFTRTGSTWSEEAKLRGDDIATGDEFAIAVAVSGDTVLAGSYLDADFGAASGSAYVFERTGTSWSQSSKLHAPAAATNEWFGQGVALEGDSALVSVTRDPGVGASVSGVVFRRAGDVWIERATIGVSTAVAGDNRSAVPLAISGTTVLNGAVGASPLGLGSGAAFVFDLVK